MKDLIGDDKHFQGVEFCNLKLEQNTIKAKEFYDCSFKSCDFSEASFLNCEFNNCKFLECNLNNIKVKNSKFAEVEFVDCKIIGVNWIDAYWRGLVLSEALVFNRCMLNSSSFYGLTLEKMVMIECRAHYVDFREANLKGANFSHTDLRDSLFNNTNLSHANFKEAENYDINIKNNLIKNATFCRYEAVSLLSSLGINLID